MAEITTFHQLLALFNDSFAKMGRAVGCTNSNCRQWRDRGFIPPKRYDAVIAAAKNRGGNLTVATLEAWRVAAKDAA